MSGEWRIMIEDVLILDGGGGVRVLCSRVVIIIVVIIIARENIATLAVWTTILTYRKYLHEIRAANS